MPTYVVDPTRFHAEGAVVPWSNVAKRLGIAVPPDRSLATMLQLRWMLDAGLGLPTEPFVVWARPHTPQLAQPLTISQRQLLFLANYELVTWAEGSMASVSVDVQAPTGGAIFAFAGAPTLGNVRAVASAPAGNATVELTASFIDGLLVAPSVTVTAVRGSGSGAYANSPGWSPVELVGLPVDPAQWGGISKQGSPQGLVGAFTDAQTAAVARLGRGGPPIGWGPLLAAGVPAPPWQPPDFALLVKEVNAELLDALRGVVAAFPPGQQAAQVVNVPLPPPENSSGVRMAGGGSRSQLAPLPMTYLAAATDPFLSLVLGFGTAYPNQTAEGLLVGGARHDFMITARWANGGDGQSPPLDYAAVVAAPTSAPAPPPPANLAPLSLGVLRPFAPDGDWRASARVSWDRPPALQLIRAAGIAAARAGVSPAAPAVALMEARPSGGYRPIAVNQAADPPDPEFWRLHVVDRELAIPANPGACQVKYGAAVQDLYGQWTPWSSADLALAQPDLGPVQLVSAHLAPTAPAGGGVCPATLEVEFLWDWRLRTPRQITFVGRLYPAATRGALPPTTAVPAGLDRSLGGGGAALVVSFSGDIPAAPGCTIIPLTADGAEQAAGFGAPQGAETRRYRLTLAGLALDFASTPFIGLALWAQGQEQIAPQRVSAWSARPMVTAAGDPRPPIVPIEHVKLGSLPDASGSSHVRLAWAPQPNAAGYFVYEASETSILDANGLPAPAMSATLDQRLQTLKAIFRANPARRPFHRLNATLLQAASLDVALPRGSTAIHLYVVLGVSAGQVESAWPAGATPDDALIAVAAPHVMQPAPPMLEVARVLDETVDPPVYAARLLVTTRPGPRPAKVELHRVRVDDAARTLDTMGPPIARVTASGGGWTVAQTADPVYGPYIASVKGTDAPAGSWRRVWYRATVWTAADDTRGGLPGRSEASNAAWVVLPPADAPVLSPLQMGGGPTPADVLLQWTCASPTARTPLGPHHLSARASVVGADAPPVLALDTTLDQLGASEPATGSGVWIVGAAAGTTTYRALIRRAAATDVVNFAVRITDPLGRTGAQLLTIAAGPADPPPDLENLQMQVVPLPLPAHTRLTFTSSSPIQAPLDGPYLLRVTLVPKIHLPFPPPPSIELPLGSVPTRPPIGRPPAFYLMRSGIGPNYVYGAVASGNVAGFVVRITAPNGQFVQKTVS